MAKYRKSRLDAAFAEACAEIVRDIKDPRVSGVMLSVLSADVSADLRFAKVYYSVYGECDEKELARGLRSALPFIRSRIASELNLRITPEISFIRDDGIRRGAEISAILKQIEGELAASDAREAQRAAEAAGAAEADAADGNDEPDADPETDEPESSEEEPQEEVGADD